MLSINQELIIIPSGASVSLVGWSIVEASMYIIATCLPHLRPLVSRHAPAWFLSVVRKSLSQTATNKSKSRSRSAATRPRPVRHTNQDDEMELTSYSGPHGVSSSKDDNFDSLENGLSDGVSDRMTTASQGRVLVTTEVNVQREYSRF